MDLKSIFRRLTGFLALFILVLAIQFLFVMPASAENQPSAVKQPAPAVEESHTDEHSETLTAQEVKSLMDKGQGVFIVDVRSLQEFHSSHIPGSVSVPLGKVETLVDSFPRETTIVFY